MKWIVFTCILSGCTLFQKNEPDELVALAESVLKHKKGIDIEIKPIEDGLKK
jgi:hypothetical protein